MIHIYFEQLTYREAITSTDSFSLSYSHGYKDPKKTDYTLLALTIYGISVPRQPWEQVSRLTKSKLKLYIFISADFRKVVLLKMNTKIQTDLW